MSRSCDWAMSMDSLQQALPRNTEVHPEIVGEETPVCNGYTEPEIEISQVETHWDWLGGLDSGNQPLLQRCKDNERHSNMVVDERPSRHRSTAVENWSWKARNQRETYDPNSGDQVSRNFRFSDNELQYHVDPDDDRYGEQVNTESGIGNSVGGSPAWPSRGNYRGQPRGTLQVRSSSRTPAREVSPEEGMGNFIGDTPAWPSRGNYRGRPRGTLQGRGSYRTPAREVSPEEGMGNFIGDTPAWPSRGNYRVPPRATLQVMGSPRALPRKVSPEKGVGNSVGEMPAFPSRGHYRGPARARATLQVRARAREVSPDTLAREESQRSRRTTFPREYVELAYQTIGRTQGEDDEDFFGDDDPSNQFEPQPELYLPR